ncbi:phosphotransferase family protein [Pseudogemmobacter sp. W21_MBD1_M6]|uniref:phosphotransferase family protein n=1 Tax=Pseudogemmobacter sp. W21_MBD1_M6 TaxID=3240271 RepID=UPI003F9C780E
MQSCAMPYPDEMPLEIRVRLAALGLIAENCAPERLFGGRTNLVWRISEGPRAVVCKLFCKGFASPLFPNDSTSEATVLASLAGTGLSPGILASIETKFGPVIVYEFVHGASWTGGAVDVGKALAKVHSHQAPEGLRILPSGSAAIAQQTLAILQECDGADADAIVARQPPTTLPPAETLCLIHGDVVPNNIIRTTAGLVFIDWQCPALGDPCEDVAMFLSPAMQALYGGHDLSADDRDAFLSAYGDLAIATRYKKLAPLFHWRMAAHCLWKSQRGERDYTPAIELELAALEQG